MIPKVFIETPRLILRKWIATDYSPFIAMNQDMKVMEFFPTISTPDETIAQINRQNKLIEEKGFGFFAMERKDNQQFIGFTGLSIPRFESWFMPCVEIGWRLSEANWGQGFATEAAESCLDFAFNTKEINAVYSFTSVHNERSERMMIKLGMTKMGYFEHPLIEDGIWLKKHVLYKKVRNGYS